MSLELHTSSSPHTQLLTQYSLLPYVLPVAVSMRVRLVVYMCNDLIFVFMWFITPPSFLLLHGLLLEVDAFSFRLLKMTKVHKYDHK